jgi:aminomethyltransferase
MDLKRTCLYQLHIDAGAYMSAFAGFMMPIRYEGILKEHRACRTGCVIFDTSHMARFFLQGPSAAEELNSLQTLHVERMEIGHCRYGFFLNDKAGILDDIIIYRIDKEAWMVVANAGTREQNSRILKDGIHTASLYDTTDEKAKIDVQGPLSKLVLESLLEIDLSTLGYYRCAFFNFWGGECLISRSGYTGELGYELYLENERAIRLWTLLLKDERVKPAGLGARDTLRLEMGFPLYGQDIDAETTPIEAGLGKFVDFSHDFLGKEALQRVEARKKLVFFLSESRRAPRHGQDLRKNGTRIGTVTSGTFSPSLEKGIGAGYLEKEFMDVKEFSAGEKEDIACKRVDKQNLVKMVHTCSRG